MRNGVIENSCIRYNRTMEQDTAHMEKKILLTDYAEDLTDQPALYYIKISFLPQTEMEGVLPI